MFLNRSLLILILSILFVTPLTSSAQEGPEIASLEIAIWPEYDRPSVLVIYQVRLAEGVPTPTTLWLPIPASVGEPHAVAAWYPDGALDDSVSWTTSRDGEWNWIEVTTVTNGLWLEFYSDLASEAVSRAFDFSWPGGPMIDSLILDVLHPIGSTDLRITPPGQESLGADGLTRTTVDLGAWPAGEPIELALSYDKPSAFTGDLPELRQNPSLAQLEVALWPEYDRATNLVIYRGGLTPGTALPAVLHFPIPVGAGEPNAVAILGEDGRLYSTDYQREVEGDWAWISFETDSLAFQMEYYDELNFEGARREYSFFWPGGFDSNSITFELQQPVGATGLAVTPVGSAQAGSDGLSYIRGGLGPQAAGTALTINFAYEKDSADLSVDAISSAPTIDRPQTTQGSTPDLTAQLPFILAGFGLALIVLGGFLYFRVRQGEQTRKKPPRQRRRKPKSQRASGDLDAAAVFCHVCGSKASASDHFCRNCGTKLRH